MKTLISVKTDSRVKNQASKLAADFGLTLSDIVNISLAQFVRNKSLYISKSEVPSPALKKAIAKAEAELTADQRPSVYSDAESALNHLGL